MSISFYPDSCRLYPNPRIVIRGSAFRIHTGGMHTSFCRPGGCFMHSFLELTLIFMFFFVGPITMLFTIVHLSEGK